MFQRRSIPRIPFKSCPELFDMVSSFLASSSHNIRVSAAECLISFLVNCMPDTVILEPSIYDEKVLEKVAKSAIALLNVKYQSCVDGGLHCTISSFRSLQVEVNWSARRSCKDCWRFARQ